MKYLKSSPEPASGNVGERGNQACPPASGSWHVLSASSPGFPLPSAWVPTPTQGPRAGGDHCSSHTVGSHDSNREACFQDPTLTHQPYLPPSSSGLHSTPHPLFGPPKHLHPFPTSELVCTHWDLSLGWPFPQPSVTDFFRS